MKSRESEPTGPCSRRIITPIKENVNSNLAAIFLMTPDMSCTDEDIDLFNPDNFEKPDPDQSNGDQEIRCICGCNHENDPMIQCDSCKKWLHSDCVPLKNFHDSGFICIYCQAKIAKSIKQFYRQELISLIPQINQIYQNIQKNNLNSEYLINLKQAIQKSSDSLQGIIENINNFLPKSSSVSKSGSETNNPGSADATD